MQLPRVSWKFLKDNAIAIAPAMAYFLAFQYESAKCDILGIPLEFVQVELTQVLLVLSLVLGIGAPLAWFLDDALEVASPSPDLTHVERVVRQYTLMTGYLTLLAYIYRFELSNLIFTAVWAGGLTLLDILAAKLGDKNMPFKQRLSGPIGVLTSKNQTLGMLKERLGTWFPILCVFLVAMYLSQHLGKSHLVRQQRFLVPSTMEDSVVVAKYGSQVFCSKFDAKTSMLKPELSIIDISSAHGIQFHIMRIGPLTPPDFKPIKAAEPPTTPLIEPTKVESSLAMPEKESPADEKPSEQSGKPVSKQSEETAK